MFDEASSCGDMTTVVFGKREMTIVYDVYEDGKNHPSSNLTSPNVRILNALT